MDLAVQANGAESKHHETGQERPNRLDRTRLARAGLPLIAQRGDREHAIGYQNHHDPKEQHPG